MKFTIIGAGAIGGTAGAYLSATGHDVLLVDNAREHVDAINERGLRVSGVRGDNTFRMRACTPDDVEAPLGVVVIAVKAQATDAALRIVQPHLAADTLVVAMQNGLTEERISEAVGADRTIGCLVHYAADYLEPGHVVLANQHEIYFGELDGRITPRLDELTKAFDALMPSIATDNIWGWKWTKMCFISLYFAGALLDIPFYEAMQARRHRATFGAVVTEAVQVAYALGHRRLEAYRTFVPAAFAEGYTTGAAAVLDSMAVRDSSSLKVYSGMQRDLMVRKRPTEVDEMPGLVIRKASRVGVAVPLHQEIVRQIKEIERGERGMGWDNIDALAEVHRASPAGAPA